MRSHQAGGRKTPNAPNAAAFGGEASERLNELAATEDELAQLSRALQAGAQPQTCIALVEIARSRRGAFTTGPQIVRLRHAGMRDATIIELARLKQVKRWTSDMVVMRQAGMRDATILEIARYRAARLPVFSGRSFAALRNAGVQDRTLLELVRRSVPEKDVELLVRMRHEGASDTKLLLRYPRR